MPEKSRNFAMKIKKKRRPSPRPSPVMGRETIRGVKYQKNKPTAKLQIADGKTQERRRQSHGLPTAK